jgi:hypothetical protein
MQTLLNDTKRLAPLPVEREKIDHKPLGRTMDEREVEQGYAGFHRALNHILQQRDVRKFKAHVAKHPGEAGRLSHCLGLSDELAEVEMYKAILVRSALRDIHPDAKKWLEERGLEAPKPAPMKKERGRKKRSNRLRRPAFK